MNKQNIIAAIVSIILALLFVGGLVVLESLADTRTAFLSYFVAIGVGGFVTMVVTELKGN